MRVRRRLAWLVDAAARRPWLTVAVVGALAVACALVALGLQPATGTGTFVSSSSADYQATQRDEQQFGGDAVVVLIREKLQNLTGSKDLGVISELEACLAGQEVTANKKLIAFEPVAAAKAKPYGGAHSPCGQLMAHKPAQVVYGPGTFLNRAVAAVNQQLSQFESSAAAAIKQKQNAAEQLARGKHLSKSQVAAAGKAAASLEAQTQYDQLAQLALDAGISNTPAIDNAQFIDSIVFDQTRGAYTPKARFSYLFPSSGAALIQVRLRSGLSSAQTQQAIGWIRSAVKMKMFRLGYGGSYVVSGEPVVLNDLAGEVTGQVAVLLIGAVVVMAIVLLLVFRGTLRLLPLGLALAAAAITFGLTALAGATLTMASIAVLPILIGLAVDYAIQFQSRAREREGEVGITRAREREGEVGIGARGDAGIGAPGGGAVGPQPAVGTHVAVAHAARTGAPTIAAAALATATGFLVLLTSPVPMVQGFGLLLVVGVAVAFLLTLSAGSAALVLRGGGARGEKRNQEYRNSTRTRLGAPVVASFRGAAEILGDLGRLLRHANPMRLLGPLRRANPMRLLGPLRRANPMRLLGPLRRASPMRLLGPLRRRRRPRPPKITRPSRLPGALAALTAHPGRVLTAGLILALAGWVLDTQTPVQSDVTKLVPSNMPALRHLNTLERITGVSGEIDVLVHAGNVATPKTVGWMIDYENQVVKHFGYVEAKGCKAATLCPALSLPDLFSTDTQTSKPTLTQASIDQLLGAVPSYFSKAVLTSDHRYAVLAFGLRLMPFSRQQQVISYLRSHLHPPAGVSAQLAGLPVLAADANAALSSPLRRLLTLVLGIVAVGLVLLAIFRSARRALTPLVPIVLATGWSALIVWAIRIPLNPMSATLGALVIAISTEFSVLLAERYRQERAGGLGAAAALERAYRSTGRAVLASGITAIAGFGVLVVSNITMLRDFGFVTIVDMTVSLAGVLLVLPAVLVAAESRRSLRIPRPRARERAAVPA